MKQIPKFQQILNEDKNETVTGDYIANVDDIAKWVIDGKKTLTDEINKKLFKISKGKVKLISVKYDVNQTDMSHEESNIVLYIIKLSGTKHDLASILDEDGEIHL